MKKLLLVTGLGAVFASLTGLHKATEQRATGFTPPDVRQTKQEVITGKRKDLKTLAGGLAYLAVGVIHYIGAKVYEIGTVIKDAGTTLANMVGIGKVRQRWTHQVVAS